MYLHYVLHDILAVIAGVVTYLDLIGAYLTVEYLSRADMQPYIYRLGRPQASRGQEAHRVRIRRLRHSAKQEASSDCRSEERQGWNSYNEHSATDKHRSRRDPGSMQ